MAKRLTEPQQRLLAEIRESSTGGLLIRKFSQYSRTVVVLVRLGLVAEKWEYGEWYWYELVPTHGTSGGVELADEVIERLADGAEQGYDPDQFRPRRRK